MAATWTTLATTASDAGGSFGLWALFSQSFDLFTIVLLLGSVVGIALIVRCVIEVREGRVLPAGHAADLKNLAERGRLSELRTQTADSRTFLGRTVKAAVAAPPGAARQAAELVASEECARLFRTVEPLNVIGNLGPLVGLAGTVWGMILAFTSLGETGGQAGAADLSLGISKALFHTLLGLLLAIPCLVAYGIYRGIVDRLCNRAMILAGEIVDRIEQHPPPPSPGSPSTAGSQSRGAIPAATGEPAASRTS